MTLNDLNKVLKTSTPQKEGFKEDGRGTTPKKHTAKKAALPTSSAKVTIKNFFAPLRKMNMDTDAPGTEPGVAEELVPGKASRPPPIVLTSATNLVHLLE
jgi:hypothetical protein